jgi:hypothetical protein
MLSYVSLLSPDSSTLAPYGSPNHPIRSRQHGGRNREPDLLCGFQTDDEDESVFPYFDPGAAGKKTYSSQCSEGLRGGGAAECKEQSAQARGQKSGIGDRFQRRGAKGVENAKRQEQRMGEKGKSRMSNYGLRTVPARNYVQKFHF